MLARILLAAAMVLFFAHAGAQYKWTDADDQTAYGDQPPKDARNVRRITDLSTAPESGDAVANLPYELRRAAHEFPAVLYSANPCPPCDTARRFLQSHAVPYTERSVSTREDAAAFTQAVGGDDLPTLTLGRNVLRGFQESAWREALAVAGYPSGLTMPPTWKWPAATPLAPPVPPAVPAEGEAAANP